MSRTSVGSRMSIWWSSVKPLLTTSSYSHNLNGTCVGYDAQTGICDSAGSGLGGVYFANTVSGRCDGMSGDVLF